MNTWGRKVQGSNGVLGMGKAGPRRQDKKLNVHKKATTQVKINTVKGDYRIHII